MLKTLWKQWKSIQKAVENTVEKVEKSVFSMLQSCWKLIILSVLTYC